MITNPPGVAHPADGDLIRYLDLQLDDGERKAVLAHLSDCDTCVERLRALREQTEVVSAYLGRLDEGVLADELARARALRAARQARPKRFGGLERVAAVAAIVGVVTLGVEPVRAWVVERLASLTGGGAPLAEVQPETVLERGSVVAFEPAGETFVLEIEHPQAVGEVRIEVRDVPSASAQIVGGRDETILVLPSGVRVENEPTSTADYLLSLPSHLRLVQVFAGGRPVAIIPVGEDQIPWTQRLPLSGSATP